jgi:hypothetical protein
MEINLNNPIFTLYINTDGMTNQRAQEYLSHYVSMFKQYENITVWIFPSNVTKMECLYDGLAKTREKEIANLIEEINGRVDILSSCGSVEDFKINLRDWRIRKLSNEL